MNRTPYLTDLSDAEWDGIASLFPAPAAHGRPRLHSPRDIFNAIVYLLRSGCAWRLLPHDLPAWKTVYHYFRLWQKNGLWERLHTALRERVRVTMGREAQPSAGIIDSQSVKTIGLRGPRGYDAGKKIKGRKRHLLVDTQGFVLKVKVHAADIMDRDGVKLLVEGVAAQVPRLGHVWLDTGYNGKGKGKDWIETTLGWTAKMDSRHFWPPFFPLSKRSRSRYKRFFKGKNADKSVENPTGDSRSYRCYQFYRLAHYGCGFCLNR